MFSNSNRIAATFELRQPLFVEFPIGKCFLQPLSVLVDDTYRATQQIPTACLAVLRGGHDTARSIISCSMPFPPRGINLKSPQFIEVGFRFSLLPGWIKPMKPVLNTTLCLSAGPSVCPAVEDDPMLMHSAAEDTPCSTQSSVLSLSWAGSGLYFFWQLGE